jgi:hypothetical protein
MGYLTVGAGEFYRRFIVRPLASGWRSTSGLLLRRRRVDAAARGAASGQRRRNVARWNASHGR